MCLNSMTYFNMILLMHTHYFTIFFPTLNHSKSDAMLPITKPLPALAKDLPAK
jgi:hypothetical protein